MLVASGQPLLPSHHPLFSLCLSHSLLASVFPPPTPTLFVLCQGSAGAQAEAASAQHIRWLSGPSFTPVFPVEVMLNALFIMSLVRH